MVGESIAAKNSSALPTGASFTDVTVIVTQINSHTITVVGGVNRPSQLPLTRQMRVLEAIATLGGFNAWAKKDRVKIIREVDGKSVEYVFNYGAFAAGKAPGSNMLLQPGDTVVVPE